MRMPQPFEDFLLKLVYQYRGDASETPPIRHYIDGHLAAFSGYGVSTERARLLVAFKAKAPDSKLTQAILEMLEP